MADTNTKGARREHMPGLDPAEVAPALDTWLERERQRTAQRVAEAALRDAERDKAFAARMARARAWGCNDGNGMCQFCTTALGVDDTGADTHPDNGCPGPAQKCAECGALERWDGKRWNPGCSAADHEARHRVAVWTLATRVRDPLALPARVHANDD